MFINPLVDRKRRDYELKVRKQRSETPYLFETGRERGSGGGNVRTSRWERFSALLCAPLSPPSSISSNLFSLLSSFFFFPSHPSSVLLILLLLSSSIFFFSPHPSSLLILTLPSHPSFSLLVLLSLLVPLPYSSFLILLFPSSLLILPLCSSFFFSPHPSIAALAPLELGQGLGLVQVPCHHQPLWQEEGGHQGEEEEGVFILFCCPSVWSDVDATNYLTTLSLYLLN